MSRERSFGPKSPGDWINQVVAWSAIIGAGVPSTTLIPLPLTQALTQRFGREELLKRLHLMVPWARFCATKLCRMQINVAGFEHLPRPSRGHLYISNHQSYVDILVLMAALDTVAFLSKSLIRRIPVIGRCAWCGGTVFMERSKKDARERALNETMRMCHQSTAVVVFPEGTRSEDGELLEKIYPRAMQEAFRRGLKVVPVAIDGTWKVYHKTMRRLHFDKPVAVRIGPALSPEGFDDVERFTEACWATVGELFQAARAANRRA